jgi:DNA-binding NarL/FixJ family response regulator
MDNRIRILLADDHTMLRTALASLLSDEPDLEVVGQAGDGIEAVAKAEELRPDVAVMDITMPLLGGLEAVRRISKRLPNTRFLILTMHENDDFLFHALQAGASGYVVKKAAHTDLIEAIHAVHRGEAFLNASALQAVLQDYIARRNEAGSESDSQDDLTERQREVLVLVAQGFTNLEIASRLVLSVKTVEKHKTDIMQRLGFGNRADLVSYALRKGLLTADQ